jgi:hypothetical protein
VGSGSRRDELFDRLQSIDSLGNAIEETRCGRRANSGSQLDHSKPRNAIT